jgi:hypothetical protein
MQRLALTVLLLLILALAALEATALRVEPVTSPIDTEAPFTPP